MQRIHRLLLSLAQGAVHLPPSCGSTSCRDRPALPWTSRADAPRGPPPLIVRTRACSSLAEEPSNLANVLQFRRAAQQQGGSQRPPVSARGASVRCRHSLRVLKARQETTRASAASANGS